MEKLNLAIIQTHLLWENPKANRAMLEEKIQSITSKVDLIVLPEMFTSGFTMKPDKIDTADGPATLDWMKSMAKAKESALLGSIIYQEGGKYFNRLFLVTPDGLVSQYDKKHTFTLAGEDKVYVAGTDRLLVTYKGFKLCPMICYDLRFPVWSRNTENYDVLIYVANWPKPRIAAWDTLLRARAIENMSYCIGANRIGLDGLGHEYPGHSAVYDVLGNPLVYSEKEEILYTTLDKEHITSQRNKLKFLNDRDAFSLK
ncbi:nitrilase family protein [Flagellimonas flava]|uniref:Omega-amidase YafV n=1 Tax=Flagellimonas flava TaxID=570519 RepID=A0A1M5KKT3_9FLAO|nr:nitrilase family protein [Allomuricauda flava]SHG53335.1 Carbon-nitrogen hydrolase [Allomuricauda flava]